MLAPMIPHKSWHVNVATQCIYGDVSTTAFIRLPLFLLFILHMQCLESVLLRLLFHSVQGQLSSFDQAAVAQFAQQLHSLYTQRVHIIAF